MKFYVYNNGKLVKDFKLLNAYMFGTDGIAVRTAEITFRDGCICCGKPNQETAGLALLWPVNEFGSVLLPTTCLPDRERPYILNIELARAKLMQVTNKREDWALFSTIEEEDQLAKTAQQKLIEAIQNINDPGLASVLADESLKNAVLFAEKLAVKQAEIGLKKRAKIRGFGKGSMGCNFDPQMISVEGYIEKFAKTFGFVTVPLNWAQIERERGQFDFSQIDKMMKIVNRSRMAIVGGPLLCFSEEFLPNWLKAGKPDFETIRDLAYNFVVKVTERYPRGVHGWRVLNSLNVYNHFGFSFEEILEMTRAANMAVKEANTRCIKIIEISNPWGEYYASRPNTIPPLVYLDMVVQGGIKFDAFGLQVDLNHSHVPERDLLQISSILDYIGPIAKPLYITDLEVPSTNIAGGDKGLWLRKWDAQKQANWIEQFYTIALSKPFVESVSYGHLADNPAALGKSGLMNEKLEPKPSYDKVQRLRRLIFGKTVNK